MQFSSITGQSEIKKKLIQTIKENRVSHTQMFTGPAGSGKLTLAIAYAQYLNCYDKGKYENDSCGVCPSCIKYDKLIHPDLHFFYPVAPTTKFSKPFSKDFAEDWRTYLSESRYHPDLNEWYEKIGIENKQAIISVRDCEDILSKLSLKAYEGPNKVVIMWMVEKLFHSAAPKILKILEEPPDKSMFILISENPEQILSTIISRCQLIRIPKIDHDSLFRSLSADFELPQIAIRRAVNQANGNFKLALKLIGEQEDESNTSETFRKWMLMCFYNNVIELNEFISEVSKIGRERQKSLLSYGLSVVRQSMLINTGSSKREPDENDSDFLTKFSGLIDINKVEQIADALNNAIFHIERNANPSLVFMDLSLTLHPFLKRSVKT